MQSHGNTRVCVVVGVGPGNGAALARKFSSEGYRVALLARHIEVIEALAQELHEARAYTCDVADSNSIASTFASIRDDLGEVDVLVYNAGSGIWGNIEEISPADFEQSWRINALGAFLASKQVIPAMKRARRGSIVFIGATASRRGGAKTAAFAPAKAAQRSLAESMARHLWPAGIHVAIVIIDAVVDTPKTRASMPEKDDSFFIRPEDVASTVFALTEQSPSAWSFEIEVRPMGETW